MRADALLQLLEDCRLNLKPLPCLEGLDFGDIDEIKDTFWRSTAKETLIRHGFYSRRIPPWLAAALGFTGVSTLARRAAPRKAQGSPPPAADDVACSRGGLLGGAEYPS